MKGKHSHWKPPNKEAKKEIESGTNTAWRRVTACLFLVSLAVTFAADRSVAVAAEANNNAKSTPEATTKPPSADSPSSPARESRDGIHADAEQAALKLVQTELPELSKVIQQLRKNQSPAYPRAIRDLARSARRLEFAKKRSERLYELELQLLKARTKVNLLTARLAVRDSSADRKRLRSSIEALQEAELARTRFDVNMLRMRLQRTQKQLEATSTRLQKQRRDRLERLQASYREQLRLAGREASDEPPGKEAKTTDD